MTNVAVNLTDSIAQAVAAAIANAAKMDPLEGEGYSKLFPQPNPSVTLNVPSPLGGAGAGGDRGRDREEGSVASVLLAGETSRGTSWLREERLGREYSLAGSAFQHDGSEAEEQGDEEAEDEGDGTAEQQEERDGVARAEDEGQQERGVGAEKEQQGDGPEEQGWRGGEESRQAHEAEEGRDARGVKQPVAAEGALASSPDATQADPPTGPDTRASDMQLQPGAGDKVGLGDWGYDGSVGSGWGNGWDHGFQPSIIQGPFMRNSSHKQKNKAFRMEFLTRSARQRALEMGVFEEGDEEDFEEDEVEGADGEEAEGEGEEGEEARARAQAQAQAEAEARRWAEEEEAAAAEAAARQEEAAKQEEEERQAAAEATERWEAAKREDAKQRQQAATALLKSEAAALISGAEACSAALREVEDRLMAMQSGMVASRRSGPAAPLKSPRPRDGGPEVSGPYLLHPLLALRCVTCRDMGEKCMTTAGLGKVCRYKLIQKGKLASRFAQRVVGTAFDLHERMLESTERHGLLFDN